MYEQQLDLASGRPVVIFLFLPLAHSLARMTQMVALDVGGTLAYWRGNPKTVLDDLAETQPTHVPSVPRVFEKIHTRALAGVEDAGRIKTALLRWSLDVGRRSRAHVRAGTTPGALLRVSHRLADRLVLAKVRGLFGGRIELALTGAAPISPDVLEFFDACGVTVLEGYGMTETTAAATLNTVDRLRFGTVGRPLPGTEVSVAGDGEILMRGPHVFAGYHRDPEATRAVMTDDGWLRSGDLGVVDDDGFLRVTGRKKDLIITSSGKNITPANLEAALAEGRWISQAVVYGDNRPYVVALVTLDPEEAPALAERCGVAPDPAAMAADPGVRALVQEEVDAANAAVARIEQVKRFAILDHELSQPDGELTPTMKIKRNVVYDRYRDVFEALYAEGEG
jgi:long-chain acyl-CoA synthetase